MNKPLDRAVDIRKGEELDIQKLTNYLKNNLPNFEGKVAVKQFPGGFSNLTYLITQGSKEWVLRKPPFGANIKSAHDMGREFKVLSLLEPVYSQIPKPLAYCEDDSILGSSFYLMERVKGIILRSRVPKGLDLTPKDFKKLSTQTIENLVELHNLELEQSNLISLGKPEGYVQRQVAGWTKRYFKAETDEIKSMNAAAEWMQSNMPIQKTSAFIHNDYKYDNLVLNADTLTIKAVLDWEMATVGDPLMDLGTSLAYWVEEKEHPALKSYNLTWVEGNLTRQEVVEKYAELRNIKVEDVLFYYVFGCFKLGVIAQQIYARYKKGYTNDERFALLIHLVKACGNNAQNAIKYNRINNFR
jgi:aminoglycoside phosphotransferase (APT) family kinase protein